MVDKYDGYNDDCGRVETGCRYTTNDTSVIGRRRCRCEDEFNDDEVALDVNALETEEFSQDVERTHQRRVTTTTGSDESTDGNSTTTVSIPTTTNKATPATDIDNDDDHDNVVVD